MQFKSTVYVVYNTTNEFGELEVSETIPMKCAIVSDKRLSDEQRKSDTLLFDLDIITKAKSSQPYCDLMADDKLLFVFDDVTYEPQVTTAHRGIDGKAKYYEISLNEKVEE